MQPPEPVPLVGAVFLRVRPWVVGPLMGLSLATLGGSGAPVRQVIAASVGMAGMLGFFAFEAVRVRRRAVTERWLSGSLAITVVGIGVGAAATGGLESPVLPMFLAPTGIALAAFGEGRRGAWVVALALGALALLAALPPGVPFPPVEAGARRWLLLASVVDVIVLLRLGVAGLSEAHVRANQALSRMREGVLEEAAARQRSLEAIGARVAHEIKNPLASIKGLAGLLAEAEVEPRRQRRFDVLRGEIARVEGILADYLAFARPLDRLDPAPFRLDELVAEVIEVVSARAERLGAAVQGDGEPLSIVADRRRLKEALLNLLSNALDAGGPGVVVRWRPRGGGAEIEVRDRGRGMTPQELARLGTPYATTRPDGVGLGVVLARAVARQHGGELRYDSEPGRGTTASLEIPAMAGRNDDDHGAPGR